MNALLEEIFATRQVVDAAGNRHDLHSEIDPVEGQTIPLLYPGLTPWSMVAFEKIGPDERPWNWYIPF